MKKFVGNHFRYPDLTGKRQAEGGMRLRGKVRESRPGLPLVTIITVCFNSSKTIEQTFRSVRNQTYTNIEYVVVDGASTDDTLDIIKDHKDLIDYYVSEPDDGLYFAMNKGLELARGDYILVLNSDDWYTQDAVQSLVTAQSYSGCDFVGALAKYLDDKQGREIVLRSMPFDDSVYFRMSLRHETMLVPAWLYDRAGFYDTKYSIISDRDLTARFFDLGVTYYEIPRALLYFRTSGISNTDSSRLNDEKGKLLAKEFPFLSNAELATLNDLEKNTPEHYAEIANAHLDQEKFVKACRALLADRRAHGGKRWQSDAVECIGTSDLTSWPKVSVILPFYEASETIARCLDSVLAQTLESLEIICVNDCAIDDSQLIVDKYIVYDPRVKCIRNSVNVGLGASRNIGIRAARGRYIFHVDPDDTLPPNALESIHALAERYGSDMTRGAYIHEQLLLGQSKARKERKGLKEGAVHIVNTTLAHSPDLLMNTEGHWSYLYRAEFAKSVNYPEDLKMGQDAIFLVSALAAAESITVIPDVVYNYLENPKSAMNVFNFQKYLDVLEWRRRAFHMLKNAKLTKIGDRFLNVYAHLPWHDQFISNFRETPDEARLTRLGEALRTACAEAGIERMNPKAPAHRRRFLQHLLEGDTAAAAREIRAVEFAPPAPRPKISVILPVYNAVETLRRSIDSALGQSLQDIELLCINDRSPDESQAIIDEYSRKDARVVPIMNEQNIGHGASRNAGIRAARGQYIFNLDPDDTLPPNALESIHALAERYGSDMTRGAYIHEQLLLGQSKARKERKGLKEGAVHIVNTTLAHSPDLLMNTEGHWSYLYRAEFAKSVNYPEDLKMGQDSIFIVNAVAQAQSISVTDALVYHYRANPNSAMNTFNFRKFMDALEWRIRAWSVLDNAGFREAGEHLLFRFWSPAFFQNLTETLSDEEKQAFDQKLGRALRSAGYPGSCPSKLPQVRQYFETVLQALALEATSDVKKPLRIATFSTMDHGGAGLGSHRRVEALRRHGVDARIHCLIKKTNMSYVHQITLSEPLEGMDLRVAWRKAAVLTRQEHPGLKARELFSKIDSVVDFRKLKHVFDRADVVHLHWVPGIVDYANMDELADKAVVWTLADMNAFTGGCHYSEGCEGYKDKCLNCPLLNEASDLPHKAWKVKRDAYEKIPNLHVVCPSEWLAECARNSSLLGGRPIHVIPNALPVDRFTLVNRFVARRKLGLPFDKKFILFGADNLTNKRKGGDILIESIKQLISKGFSGRTEALFFGSGSLDLGIPSHSMGSVSDELKMSLIYAAADVFAFPSREDNAPLTVAESMLSGTPVVAFPVGNVNELVIHMQNGYIASYGNPVDFAKGLEWALSDTGSSQALLRGLRAHRSARVHNDPSTSAQRHIALYSKMLNAPKR